LVALYPPVTTFPGSAVGARGARTDGVNEFGPPGVMVGAFSVGDGGASDDGAGALELWVGDRVSDGLSLSLSLLQPAVMAVIPMIATPPRRSPIRADVPDDVMMAEPPIDLRHTLLLTIPRRS
jgi:hypothetical protein